MEIEKAPIIPLTYQICFPPLFPSSPSLRTTFEICEFFFIFFGGCLLELNSVHLEIYF